MKKLLTLSLILLSLSALAGDLPDPKITPGAINPNVTQSNINTNICVSGWTQTIRPSSSYTNKLKISQMKAMGLTGPLSLYEEDHLISLQLGGHPTDPKNLWPQVWDGTWGAHKKDQVETRLKVLVCSGKLPLAQAQHDIATNWIAAFQKYVVVKK